MVSKLPAWVGIGAFFLAFTAGCVNAFTFLSVLGESVSHVSGTSTNFVLALAQGDFSKTLHFFLILLSFLLGSTISGALIRDSHLQLGRRYGFALLLEGTLLVFAWYIFKDYADISHLVLSLACGLQNAMASTYSGAVVRTTHMTGLFTDLGILLGNSITGIPFDKKKFRLYTDLIGGYFFGGLIAGLSFNALNRGVILISAFITLVLASVYFISWFDKKQKAKKQKAHISYNESVMP